jgi:DNA-binding beta-propeller fold protein YncE
MKPLSNLPWKIVPAAVLSGVLLFVISPVTVARLQQRAASAGRAATVDEAKKVEVANRKPLRIIRDRYALFSAVAVDAERNEVVLQDENMFRTLVYDRTTNTPPNAALSEPKRIIGGPKTHLELNCGVYIDPKTGNIFAVNNDTEDHLVVFDRQAKGDVEPTWMLHTPHGAFGIAVDEPAEEMIFTIQHSNAVVAFRKTAKDDDPPTWLLQGDRTLLADPHGIALDNKRGLIFVTNFGSTATPRADRGGIIRYNRTKFKPGSKAFWPLDPGQMVPGSGRNLPATITVYDKKARGDAPPLRVISGPKTQLDWAEGLFVDEERGELYVANDAGGSVLVYSTEASGDAAPLRILKGPHTLLHYPSSVYIDFKNDELWVANFGNHTTTVYKRAASGDAPPIRQIRSAPTGTPAPALANARIGYDTKREQILAPN